MIKKFMAFILCLLLTLSLMACSGGKTQTSSTTEETELPNSVPIELEQSDKNINSEDEAVNVQRYAVGDIILADGSVATADLTVIDSGNLPIAVIAGFTDDGTAFGVGVHRSDTPLQWAPDGTVGYGAEFADIICTQDTAATFSGDTDGSDNWDVILSDDAGGAADAAKNYPAFHFVNTYAQTYNLQGSYASGWYMPSIAELSCVYENSEAVNTSLQKIYELNSSAAMNGLDTNWYWSSSQAEAENGYAWFIHFFNGYAGECPKNFTNVHALAVRTF